MTKQYYCTAVGGNSIYTDTVSAVSHKQAEFFFKKKFGWNVRGLVCWLMPDEEPNHEQIKFEV